MIRKEASIMREGGPGCVKDVKGRNLIEKMKLTMRVDEEMPGI